ncbi:MAG TPA: HdeD family acid-resistance protein [Ktedonobacteraceae bacterium]
MQAFSPTRLVSRYWWLMLIWGILVVLFGLCAIFWPHITLLVLVSLFGAFALVNGVLAIFMAIQERHQIPYWGTELALGILSLIVGLGVMFWPGLSALVILYMIATWAIITGIFQLVAAFSGMFTHSPIFLAIAGIASIILGIVLFVSSPAVALLAMVWVIGVYALVDGFMLIGRAFHFRSLENKQLPHREPEFLR